MPIDPLPVWKTKFAQIPQDPTGLTSPTLISTFVFERVTGKLTTGPVPAKFDPPPSFQWILTFLESTLRELAVVPALEPVTPNTKIGNAWAQGTSASVLAIAPGSIINPPPPGTNGIVATAVAVIDPASVTAATSKLIADLIASPPSPNPLAVVFPVAFYEAFTKLRWIVTGLDTKPPPTGPIPFSLTLSAF